MKRIIYLFMISIIFSSFSLSAPFGAVLSHAAGEKYSRILSEDVVLYMDSTLTIPWFTLPYSYYVKVLSVSGNSAKVEYRGDNPSKPSAKGYIKTEELNIASEVPEILYPSVTLTVNQTCMLYKDSEFTITETVTQNSVADYYGTIVRPNGEKYVYCLVTTTSGDKYLGYMSINSFFSYTLPSLPVEAESCSDEEAGSVSEAEAKSGEGNGNVVQLVVIIAVSAVAISIVYLLFRPAGRGKAKDEAITSGEFGDDDY